MLPLLYYHFQMPKFCDCIMAAELAVNTITPQILVCNNQESLYLHNNPNHRHSLSAESILLERIGAEFVIYQNEVAGIEITNDFDVLNWFQI